MKLLIDIGHPAHVHLFHHLANELQGRGWQVLFSVRPKGYNVELLKAFNLPYTECGVFRKSIKGKIASVISRNIALYRIFRSYKPTITISHSSFYLSQVSWFCGVPNITLEDTGNLEQVLLYLPFTDAILTPETYHRNHGKKQIRYNGFHENAYIHSDFLNHCDEKTSSVPDTILIRLVDWSASHDLGHHGLTFNELDELLKLAGNSLRVKILSEKPLPAKYLHLALQIEPAGLHDYLNQVRLYIGEGATLASECALRGIPTIYVNSRKAGVIAAQAAAGLLFHYKSSDGIIKKTQELLSNPLVFDIFKARAADFLKDKINLSRFLVWFVENFPHSKQIMIDIPKYQYNFK